MFFTLKSFFIAALATSIVGQAAPTLMQERQIGDLQCNLDRAGIVASLFAMQGSVNSLKSDTASDATNSALMGQVQSGLNTANSGIETIAAALITGQKAPSAARDTVAQGLTTMLEALNNVTSTSSTVQSKLATAKTQLQDAIKAGNGVVSNCK